MALLHAESFASYATANDMVNRGYTVFNPGTFSFGTPYHRISGNRGLQLEGTNGIRTALSTTSTIGLGFAFRLHHATSNSVLVALTDTTNTQVRIKHKQATNTLDVERGSGSAVLGSIPIRKLTWYYLELKATINSTTGSIEVRLNGNSTPVLSLSSSNTQATGNATIDGIRLAGDSAQFNNDFQMCDYVIWDTTGSYNNDFLGDVRVQYCAPDGAGESTGWTASTGLNYQCVDETPFNDADYVESSAANNRDLYTVQNVAAATGTVKAVQVIGRAFKTDAGARTMALLNKSGTTETVGTTINLASSAAFYTDLWETNPDTGTAWTISTANAVQIGVKDLA